MQNTDMHKGSYLGKNKHVDNRRNKEAAKRVAPTLKAEKKECIRNRALTEYGSYKQIPLMLDST